MIRVSHHSFGDPELTGLCFFLFMLHLFFHCSDERPKRVNRGKGGAAAQLAAVSARIRPDLSSTKQSKTVEMHGEVPINAMAPVRQVRGVSDQTIFALAQT